MYFIYCFKFFVNSGFKELMKTMTLKTWIISNGRFFLENVFPYVNWENTATVKC